MIEGQTGGGLAQLRRGVAEACTLAFLRDGERYGFDLARTLAQAGLIAGEGTIYPLLARLRRAGWVETLWRESDEGPPRRYYRLTPAGRRALARFQAEWHAFRDAVDRILAQPPPGKGEDHGP